MLSVIIPTFNSADTLPATLSALVDATLSGIVKEVVIADGGSCDGTEIIADAAGCHWVTAGRGRGPQLAAGAAEASRGAWLLFLHSDTVLSAGWEAEVAAFVERTETSGDVNYAAAFRFALDGHAWQARLLEKLVAMRCAVFGLPYGDQGLLISRRFHDDIGGYRPMPLMEDVDIVRRIGWRRMKRLRTEAVTSDRRYRKDGYFRRSGRNLLCLMLYFLRLPPRAIARLYG